MAGTESIPAEAENISHLTKHSGGREALARDHDPDLTELPEVVIEDPQEMEALENRTSEQDLFQEQRLRPWLEYVSLFSHLAVFGILGVLIRYGLELLFGPEVTHVTDDEQSLFLDLPANMFGSFLMGWVGVVFKRDIAAFSEPLAVGLSTGLCGSITTYASWIQRMLAILTQGRVMKCAVGIILGAELAQMSLRLGIDAAEGFQGLIASWRRHRQSQGLPTARSITTNHIGQQWLGLILFFSSSFLLLILVATATALDNDDLKRHRLWMACLFAPPGVWVRWYLAKLNGQGVGQKGKFLWLPVGTFLTNIIAGALESILSTVNIAVENRTTSLVVGALQLGTLACMSTVSTLAVEIQTLHSAGARWCSYAYYGLLMATSLIIGLLVYSIPVWAGGYLSRYNHI